MFVAGLLFAGVTGCDGGGNTSAGTPATPAAAAVADGQRWFSQTCVACHGPTGHGVPRMGPSLHNNRFIADSTDDQLTTLLREGRSPTDPKSVTKLPMPARGGNPNLTDDHLRQVVAYLREMQKS
jgi:mono/diheme cytochrome c family protein